MSCIPKVGCDNTEIGAEQLLRLIIGSNAGSPLVRTHTEDCSGGGDSNALLQEDGNYILQENGSKILLE